MPQALSKCRRPSRGFTSAHVQDKARIWCARKRLKVRKKANYIPVPTGVSQEEDWEQEIEEFSCKIEEQEKELSNETPYDAEEMLKVELCEMSLYSIPCAPRPHPQHYNPSEHHTPPVRWVQHLPRVETDQFADAEE